MISKNCPLPYNHLKDSTISLRQSQDGDVKLSILRCLYVCAHKPDIFTLWKLTTVCEVLKVHTGANGFASPN